jgi:hypothetical protein
VLSPRLGRSSARTFSGSFRLDGSIAPAGFQGQAVRPPGTAGIIRAGWSGRVAARGGGASPRGWVGPVLFVKRAGGPMVLGSEAIGARACVSRYRLGVYCAH